MKNTFYISCPIDTYSGYGSRSRDFVRSIIEMDRYEVKVLPQRWGNCAWGFIDDHMEEWGFLKSHIIPQINEQPDIWCQISVPNEFQNIGKYNIGLTAGIETTICAPQWIEGINRMDLNLVSSEHSKRVFETSAYEQKDGNGKVVKIVKLEKPIHVLMEGADIELYKPLKKSDLTNKQLVSDIDSIKEDFAFLFVGHWMQGEMGEDRKNVSLLVKLFYEMFKNKKKPPALILKTSIVNASQMGKTQILKRLKAIRDSIDSKNLPNVYVLHGDFNNKEINELYNHPKVKSMISLTKGEGFGRPLLEFSLVNKPIIASNWSGQLDFLNTEFVSLVGGNLKQVHPSAIVKDIIVPESQWFSPNTNDAASTIMDVYSNYKEWKVRAKRQGYYARSNFSYENMKNLVDEILTKNVPTISKEMPLNLPKLTKSKDSISSNLPSLNLPKLKKVGDNSPSLPKINLPKLKKV